MLGPSAIAESHELAAFENCLKTVDDRYCDQMLTGSDVSALLPSPEVVHQRALGEARRVMQGAALRETHVKYLFLYPID